MRNKCVIAEEEPLLAITPTDAVLPGLLDISFPCFKSSIVIKGTTQCKALETWCCRFIASKPAAALAPATFVASCKADNFG